MSDVLRVIDTGLRPARWNIAATAALVDRHRGGAIPDTLRFHRYPRSVLIGRQQVLEREVHLHRCRQAGVEIARRVTGGGAVYMAPGVLAFDIVAGRHRFGSALADVSQRLGSALAAGLARLGVASRFRAPGDIVVGGRKISGSSGGFDGPTLVMQGAVLVDFNRDDMAAVLQAPSRPVTSLAECLVCVPSVDAVKDALLAELSVMWRSKIDRDNLCPDEAALADAMLADEIGTDEFVNGPAPPAAAVPASAGALA